MIQQSRSSVLQLKFSFSWVAHQPQNSSKWEMYLNLDKSLFCPARTLSSLVSIILHTLAHSLYVATRQRRFVALISLRSTIKLPALSARTTRTEKAWNMTPSRLAISVKSPTEVGFSVWLLSQVFFWGAVVCMICNAIMSERDLNIEAKQNFAHANIQAEWKCKWVYRLCLHIKIVWFK